MSIKRFAYSILTAFVLVVATAGPAAAHVTVQPGQAVKGSFAKIAFRVPNESDTAGTVKLEVTFPTEAPIASARTRPMPGWVVARKVDKLTSPVQVAGSEITEAIRTITWTAEPGVRIGPGEFTEFEVSLGRLPDNADRLVLPATQTYDDGEVVRWEQPPPDERAEEPEHPAPVLELVQEQEQAAGANTGADATTVAVGSGQDSAARWLGGIGLVAAALALGVVLGTLFASRRRARPE